MKYVYFATKQTINANITKREEVTKQGFCKYSKENSVLREVFY